MAVIYTYKVTGDCLNTSVGSFSLTYTAESSAVYVTWVNPISGNSFSNGIISNPYTVTGLTGGSYSFYLSESSVSQSSESYSANIFITTGCNITLSVARSSSCALNNGILVAQTSANDNVNTIEIYTGQTFIKSGTTRNNTVNFANLNAGVYYAKVYDNGGCSNISNSIILHGSTPLDFGFYIVNVPSCSTNNGKLYVTGVTGTPPFSYSWSGSNYVQNITEDFLTGLTPGNFSCTVTDYYGCSLTKYTRVGYNETPIVESYLVTEPACFQNNGSATFNISGGTAPFYYQLSNGQYQVLLSNQVTFTGLSSGSYILTVTDAGLCTATQNFTLLTPNSFSVVSTSYKDESCNILGSVSSSIQGGTPPYTYTISSTTYSSQQTSNFKSNTFSGLKTNNYILTITDKSNSCVYTENIFVDNLKHFDFFTTGNSTTCGSYNGSINISVTEYITGLTYTYFLSDGRQSSETSATTYNFENLNGGFYDVTVVDSLKCSQLKPVYIGESTPFSIFLYPTSCYEGSSGTITALIKDAEGPFNLVWSSNAGIQNGIYATGLTAGTYYLTVSGENGCQQVASTVVECNPLSATNYSFKYSGGVAKYTPATSLTLKQMMYNGFESLVTNGVNCSLRSASFSLRVSLAGENYSFPFYFTQSFDNIPELDYFSSVLENAILTIPNIESCTVNTNTRTIDIVSKVSNGVESYKDETITFTVVIDFEINCLSLNDIICVSSTPTSTPTPTITPTITNTPSITPTISLTSTVTRTPSQTPTNTSSPTVTPTITRTPTTTPTQTKFRESFFVYSGSSPSIACSEDLNNSLLLFASNPTFDLNTQFFNLPTGNATYNLSGYYSYNGVYCELDISGNVVGSFSICTSQTPTVTPTSSNTPTPTVTPSITPTITTSKTPTVTPTKTITPTITVTSSIAIISLSLGTGVTQTTSCSNYYASPQTLYMSWTGGSSVNAGDVLYTNTTLSTTAPNGYYSNGTAWYQVTGGTGTVISLDPNGCIGLITPTPTPTITPSPSA